MINCHLKYLLLPIFIFQFFGAVGQDLLVIKSDHLKMNDTSFVFKPSSYDMHLKYPVVFLLHWHSANYKSWSKLADLQSLSDQYHFIIVCPDGLKRSWYINSLNADSAQYEDFFLKELIPRVNKDFKTDTKKLFITGASIGGFGAMYLFLNHPDVFLSAGSTSGVLNLRHSGFKKTTLAYLLGPYADDNKAFDEYSPVNRLNFIKDLNKTRFLIVVLKITCIKQITNSGKNVTS